MKLVAVLAVLAALCAGTVAIDTQETDSLSPIRARFRALGYLKSPLDEAKTKWDTCAKAAGELAKTRQGLVKEFWKAKASKEAAGKLRTAEQTEDTKRNECKNLKQAMTTLQGKFDAWKKTWSADPTSAGKCVTKCVHANKGYESRKGKIFGKDNCPVIKDAFPAFGTTNDPSAWTECLCPEWSVCESTKKLNFIRMTTCSGIAVTFEDNVRAGGHLAFEMEDFTQPYAGVKAEIIALCKKHGKIKAYGVAGFMGENWVWDKTDKGVRLGFWSEMVGHPIERTPAAIATNIRDDLKAGGCTFTSDTLAPAAYQAHTPANEQKDLIWDGAAFSYVAKFEERNTQWPFNNYKSACAEQQKC